MDGPKFHVANPLGGSHCGLFSSSSAFSALPPWPSSGSSTIHSSSIAIEVPIPEEIEIKTSTRTNFMVAEKKTMTPSTDDSRRSTLIFAYGTLKRGFSNHCLIQDMIAAGDAAYLGVCRTAERQPLVCGPYRVPFLLNLPGSGERVWGELYAVSSRALARMDELEGTSLGHYERFPVKVDLLHFEGEGAGGSRCGLRRIMGTGAMRRRCGRGTGRKGTVATRRRKPKGT